MQSSSAIYGCKNGVTQWPSTPRLWQCGVAPQKIAGAVVPHPCLTPNATPAQHAPAASLPPPRTLSTAGIRVEYKKRACGANRMSSFTVMLPEDADGRDQKGWRTYLNTKWQPRLRQGPAAMRMGREGGAGPSTTAQGAAAGRCAHPTDPHHQQQEVIRHSPRALTLLPAPGPISRTGRVGSSRRPQPC